MIAEQEADRTLAVLKIIWLSLTGSLAVYVVVGLLVAPDLAGRDRKFRPGAARAKKAGALPGSGP